MTYFLITNIFVFIFGTIFGSFFNVCIYRLPLDQSVVWPGSHCPACRKPIRWYDNIPILSFVLLGGKCRDCKGRISPRYAVIELVTGIAFLWIWRIEGWTLQGLEAAFLFSALLIVSAVDLEHQIIPDEISLGGLLIGISASFIFPSLHREMVWWRGGVASLIGVLAGGGLIYGTGVLGTLIFKKDAMGGGDVKLMAMMGAFLGWQKIILVFFMAPVLALPTALFFKFVKRVDVIPFGPFLSLAGWIAFLWGDVLIRWYWRGMF